MNKRFVSRLAMTTCQLVMAGTAIAQQAPAAVDSQGPQVAGDTTVTTGEIIVTAERRSQSLQKLPTTATAILGKDLDRQQMTKVDDLIKSTPGLAINDAGLGKFINIRGVGKTADAPGISPGVAYYVDGVPIPNQVFLDTPFFDLARVEVLRGPQGTLVGMNSTGGAILLVSQAPRLNQIGGSLEQSFGNHGEYRTRAMANLGGEKLGLRVVGEAENRDSFYTNVGPARDHPGNVDRRSVRATLDYNPQPGVEILLHGEYDRSKSDGLTGKPIPGDPDPAYLFAFVPNSPADPFQIARFLNTYKNTEYFRTSAEVRVDVADAFQLRSVTGYQRGILHLQNDLGNTGIPTAKQNINISEPVFTQEVNLISKPGGKLDWVLGGFYLHQNTNGLVNVQMVPSSALVVNLIGQTRIRNAGAFGQASYHATDKLNLTVGLRFNNERHYLGAGDFTTIPTPGGPITIPATTVHTNDNALTGRATLDYAITPTEFAYVTVSRGFKAGGINDPSPTPTFAPETVWNYEAGLKSTLLDRKIRTQFGVFYDDIHNLQYNVYNATTTQTAVQNLRGGKTYGAEFQVQGQFGGLGLNSAIAYTKSSVNGQALVDPRYGSSTPVQIGGRPFNFSPKFSFSAGMQYDVPVGRDYTLTPRVQFSHVSGQWATFYHVTPTDYIGGHDLVDANVLLKKADTGLSAELYVSNLFNKTYIASKSVEGAFNTPGRVQYYGAPRQFGVRVGYSF